MILSLLIAMVKHRIYHLLHPSEPCGIETKHEHVVSATMHRQMLYDSFDDPEAIAEVVGLPPISAELVEMERRDHIARFTAVAPVAPLLLHQADFMADVAVTMQRHENPGLISDEEAERMRLVFGTLLRTGMVAGVSSSVNLGVLEVTGMVAE